MFVFVCVYAMTVGAKNFALVYFSQQLVHRHFRVLANAERFVATYVVEIKRGRMRVVPTRRAAALSLNLIKQITPYLLKRLRYQLFRRRIVPAFRRAKFLPSACWRKQRGASRAIYFHSTVSFPMPTLANGHQKIKQLRDDDARLAPPLAPAHRPC